MLNWLAANIGTILISIILAGIITTVVFIMYHDKRKGKSSCCGNCGHCTMENCHHK